MLTGFNHKVSARSSQTISSLDSYNIDHSWSQFLKLVLHQCSISRSAAVTVIECERVFVRKFYTLIGSLSPSYSDLVYWEDSTAAKNPFSCDS